MSDPKGGSGHLWVKGRLAAQYLSGCLTYIRTVEVEPYAAGQHLHVFLEPRWRLCSRENLRGEVHGMHLTFVSELQEELVEPHAR
jgi:hypothetical protein